MSLFVPNYKFLPTKTASQGLILQILCILGPITCHRLTLKGNFFLSQEKAQGRTKNPMVMNLNISADDISTFKSLKYNGHVLSDFQDVKYLG